MTEADAYRYRIHQLCTYFLVQRRSSQGRWKKIEWWEAVGSYSVRRHKTHECVLIEETPLDVPFLDDQKRERIRHWDSSVLAEDSRRWWIAAHTTSRWAGQISIRIYTPDGELLHELDRRGSVIGDDNLGFSVAHVYFSEAIPVEFALGLTLFHNSYLS